MKCHNCFKFCFVGCLIFLNIKILQSQNPTSKTYYYITNRWTKDKLCAMPYNQTHYPTTAVLTDHTWVLENEIGKSDQIRLKNIYTGKYLMSFQDSLYLGVLNKDSSNASLKLEKINADYFRIGHVNTGSYLNTERYDLEMNKAQRGWFSGHWKFTKADTLIPQLYTSIQNRWTKDYMIDSSSIVRFSASDSMRWFISSVPDFAPYVYIKSFSQSFLHAENGLLKVANYAAAHPTAMWRLEVLNAGDWYRIRNVATGQYINSERGKLYLGQSEKGWWQTHWKLKLF